jgi:hypothetical protein
VKTITKTTQADFKTQNTQLLFFGAIGKGSGRQNVTILFDEENTRSVKVLGFKLSVGSKNGPQKSYLIKAGYFIKPEVRSIALKLSEIKPGEVEESTARKLFESSAELGGGNCIMCSTASHLLKMNTAVLMLHEQAFADKDASQKSRVLLNHLVGIMTEVINADSRAFKLERLRRV